MNINFFSVRLVATSLLLAGCKFRSLSHVLHTADDPVALGKGYWIELSREEYPQAVGGLIKSASLILPESDPLTVRTDYWLQLIDSRLRARYPEKLAGVPVPKAAVIKSRELNAFSSPTDVCWTVPIELTRGASTSTSYLAIEGSDLKAIDETSLNCPVRPFTSSVLGDRLKPASGPCAFVSSTESTTDHPKITISSSCQKDEEVAALQAAKGFRLPSTINWITVYSNLIAQVRDEREYVAILAHELAHYYRAHTVPNGLKYNFFYVLGIGNSAITPVPDSSVTQLGQSLLSASQWLENAQFAKVRTAGVIPTEQYLNLTTIEGPACPVTAPDCESKCRYFRDLPIPVADDVRNYPFNRVVALNEQNSGDFRRAFNACAALKTFALDGSGGRPREFSGMSILVNLDPSVVVKINSQLAEVRDLATATATLFDVLNNITIDAYATLEKARLARLGYYTIEQEADELAVEWLALSGIDPRVFTKVWLESKWSEGTVASDAAFSQPTMAECESLYSRGWKDAAGNDALIPLGDYAEGHHNRCYRAWNSDREIAAHSYTVAASEAKFPDPKWDVIRMLAAAASG